MKIFKLVDTFTPDGFYLTQSYGVNPSYYSKFGLLYHEGVDVGHKNKTQPVRACHDGECLTNYSNAYGRYVILLDYEQLYATWYCHLSRAKVVNGQRVGAGEIIGNMGSTGNSTGPHVHFNFVQIDKNGYRLYKTKQSNYGFLDPQHPLDPQRPKFPPGVPEYKIEWKKGGSMPDELKECLKAHSTLMAKIKRLEEEIKEWKEITKKAEDERDKLRETLKREVEASKTRIDEEKKRYKSFVQKVAEKLGSSQQEPEILEEITRLVQSEDKIPSLEKENQTLKEALEKKGKQVVVKKDEVHQSKLCRWLAKHGF